MLLECRLDRLDYVSLNGYTAKYPAYVEIKGPGHSAKSLFYFWEHVQYGIGNVSELRESYHVGVVGRPEYRDSGMYDANALRWSWGPG